MLLAVVAAPDTYAQDKNPIADSSSPLYGWEKYTSDEGKFSVILPARPKEQTINAQAKDGEVHVVHLFQSPKDDHHVYQVSYFDLLRTDNDPKLLLANVEKNIITKEQNPKIVFYKSFQMGNHPATEFEFAGGRHPNFSSRIRLILVGQRVYTLTTVFVTTDPNPDERNAFFDSFSLQ
jgi:hypothetical protein